MKKTITWKVPGQKGKKIDMTLDRKLDFRDWSPEKVIAADDSVEFAALCGTHCSHPEILRGLLKVAAGEARKFEYGSLNHYLSSIIGRNTDGILPGSVCPHCGTDDVDIEEGSLTCNGCGATGRIIIRVEMRR